MACCNANHKKVDPDTGVGKCSVPMWASGCPAGFCDNDAYGKQTAEGQRRYSGYVPFLACFAHGGPQAQEAE